VTTKRLVVWFFTFFVIYAGWLGAPKTLAYSPKQIYQKAGPGVVFIFASKGGSKGSGGTGSIISKDGLVITNAHLFKPQGSTQLLTEISVFLKPERVTGNHKTDLANGYRGKILAYDIPLDLALIKIIGFNTPLKTVNFADSEKVDIGEQVYAIGHPEQGGLWSLTSGVISAYWSNYGGVSGKNLFQTDASINRGNSGGPLLDSSGDMIGINSMIARKAADGLTITDVNFSIRSSVALNWLKKEGYRFAAVQPEPDESAKQPNAAPAVPQKVTTTPVEPEEKATSMPETAAAPPEKEAEPNEGKKEQPEEPAPLVKQDEKPVPSPKKSEPGKADQAQPIEKEPADDLIAQNPKEGEILTEKKPYRMDELLEGMREMEDMMDEMKNMMDDFKKRRKK